MPKKLIVLSRTRRRLSPPAILALALTLLLLARALAVSAPLQPALAPSLAGLTLVIDPGHGGADPGAVGSISVEKDINLATAQALAGCCRSAGAEVILTRQEDAALAGSKGEDLAARVELARSRQADIFISLHCNSFVSDPGQHGAQVFYAPGSEAGEKLARSLQQALADHLGNTDRSALPHPDSYLLRHLDCPAVIVELGFLSNPEEEERLAGQSWRLEAAWALYKGLGDYLGQREAGGRGGSGG